VEVYLICNYL